MGCSNDITEKPHESLQQNKYNIKQENYKNNEKLNKSLKQNKYNIKQENYENTEKSNKSLKQDNNKSYHCKECGEIPLFIFGQFM